MPREILTFSSDVLPLEFKWQILSFMRVQWPEGFRGKLRLRDWIGRSDFHPLHFLLVEQAFVISHCEVIWKHLLHAEETYKVYGLSGVFTFPDHQRQGYGKRIVEAATEHILQSGDADVAMLWCEPHNRPFYLKCGWHFIENAQTLITAENGSVFQDSESLMMLFLSDKGLRTQAAFWKVPIYFGDTTW